MAAALALLLLAVDARADPAPEPRHGAAARIPPGREEVVLAVVRGAMTDARVDLAWDVAIGQDAFEVRLRDGRTLVVAAPGATEAAASVGDRVALRCAPECTRSQREESAPLGRALALRRDRAAPGIWELTAPLGAGVLEGLEGSARWWDPARMVFFGGALLAVLVSARRLARWRPRAWDGGLLLVIAAATCLSVVGAWGTLHEHNAFAPRLDCAHALTCTEDPRAPGWAPAFFLTYGPLLHLLPYTLEAPVHLSRAFAALSLGLLATLVRDLLAASASPRFAAGAGLGAAALLGLNPVSARLASADSPWPFVIACLLAAALLARRALREGSASAGLAAGALLVPVVGGNLALLAVWPAVTLAPLAWARGVTLRGTALTGLALALPAAVTLPASLSRLPPAGALQPTIERALVVPRFLPLDFRFVSPLFVAGILAAGVWLAGQRTRGALGSTLRTWSPMVLLLGAHPALDAYGGALGSHSHPVGALNHHLSMVLAAALAGVGLAEVDRRATGWGRAARLGAGGAALLAWVLPLEGWDLWRRHHVPSAEGAMLARELPRLPAHQTLVVASALQARLAEPSDGDPVELHYPIGAHRAAVLQRGDAAPLFVTIPELLAAAPQPRVLVYVGAALRSFKPGEVAAGAVPETLERPELTALQARYRLEPAVTFELPTAQSRFVTMRLGADRVPTVTLGYYWATPRP